MAKRKSSHKAAEGRVAEQVQSRSELEQRSGPALRGAEPNPSSTAASGRKLESKPVDGPALTRDVIAECRLNLGQLQDAGKLLDRMYSREALAKRRVLYFERQSAPKEIEYDIKGPDGGTRRVRRAANYGGNSWACQQDWPTDAEPTKQLMLRLMAALNDVMDGLFHYDLRPTVDRMPASIVLLLHWVLTDESATSLKPTVCEFQSLPWFNDKMVGRRTAATQWFGPGRNARWYERVTEALDWARLNPDWKCRSAGDGLERDARSDGRPEIGARPQARPELRADQLSAPESAVLIALERARRESPPRALDGAELRNACMALPTDQRHEFRDDDHVRRTVYKLRDRKLEIPNPRNKRGYSLKLPLQETVPDLAKAIS